MDRDPENKGLSRSDPENKGLSGSILKTEDLAERGCRAILIVKKIRFG